MKNGWIKLHKKIIDNEVWQHDLVAWHVFEGLLAIADIETGDWSGGRFQLSELLSIKPTTIYKALKRLEKAKMVTLSSNNKYTTIHICKWRDYQGNGNSTGNTSSNNKVTTKGQQSNTLIRTKNKELRNMTTSYGKPEINDMFDYWQETTGLPITAKVKLNRNACNNLIKKHGEENLKRLIEGVSQAQGDQYAPRIANFVQLQSKVDDLILWGKKKGTNKIGVKL